MKEAFSGIFNLIFVAIFLVLVEGILGFLVSYTKAFRMKNSIITTIEQYEAIGCGVKTSDSSSKNTACLDRIDREADKLHYSTLYDLKCPSGFEPHYSGYFCYSEKVDSSNRRKYTIVTQVDLNIPIINKIGFSMFRVMGETRGIRPND